MNLDSLSFTLSQISYLVGSLTKKNYKQVVTDLSKVSARKLFFVGGYWRMPDDNRSAIFAIPSVDYACTDSDITVRRGNIEQRCFDCRIFL